MAVKARYKRRRFQNKAGIVWASIVVLILVAAVSIKSIGLLQKSRGYKEREEALTTQIEAEMQRSDEIAEFERYTHTRKYIEETAKDKLGLVYPGEIIFKNENN